MTYLIHITRIGALGSTKSWCGEDGPRNRDERMTNCPACLRKVREIESIDRIMAEMTDQFSNPDYIPPRETSNQMREHADQKRSMTTGIYLAGGEVKEDYRWRPRTD